MYEGFFKKATGFDPYPYQHKLASGLDLPILLNVPTGAGKTEAAILGWLYRRCKHPDDTVRDSTPRRLVYCLPTRVLVEQCLKRIECWLGRLDMTDDVGVVALMGGEPRVPWYLEPEKPFIAVGTQDMLLSRALNRGFGLSCNMWPVEYGLLNNDCLWVMDEVQLMETGLPTSTQLAGLRCKLGAFGPVQSMWMSATARTEWLDTVDFPIPSVAQAAALGDDDLAHSRLHTRHYARKVVTKAMVDFKKPKKMAELIENKHRPKTLTLVIVNTVERAQGVYAELAKPGNRILPHVEKVLVHSRFREDDRKTRSATIAARLEPAGRIVVATQAVEAGVDISARTLITELAPWASMVQRFGRCNREGGYDQGEVFWVDLNEKSAAPYEAADVGCARDTMESLEGRSVGPAELQELSKEMEDIYHLAVVRKRDVIGLFDTTPDLSGNYLDVSQYVRGTEESSVSVFWRDVPEQGPENDDRRARHDELVHVPLGARGLSGYFKLGNDGRRKAWRWDFLDSEWQRVQTREIRPGMTLMLDAQQGGYDPDIGWAVTSMRKVDSIGGRDGEPEDGQGSERTNTRRAMPVTLSAHSRHVEREAELILDAFSDEITESGIRDAVLVAALNHDVGKAHRAFQRMLRKGCEENLDTGTLWAKSPGNGKFGKDRRHFRHELGSALALLEHAALPDGKLRDLAAYLAAAHHGKVRLSMRSLPGARERNQDSNPDPDTLLGHTVSKPEMLPEVDLGEGLYVPETPLDLSIARIGLSNTGQRSWLERILLLLDWLGPFKLAYLEAIVRVADMRASKNEQGVAE